MAKRITTDTEYWQWKDDCEKAYAASEKETDKKRRKELLSTVKENQKLLADYAKRKKKDTLALIKKEIKLAKIRNKTKADKQIILILLPWAKKKEINCLLKRKAWLKWWRRECMSN